MASRQKKHHTKKEFHSHAVGHSRPSRLDRKWPLTWYFAVGVAGFEPTASSSRTAVRGWSMEVVYARHGPLGALWDGAGQPRCCISQLYSGRRALVQTS
jgi:hypothetical protein